MYKCEHFKIHELVPQHVYEVRKEKAWELLDVRLLRVIDLLRVNLGPAIINNWWWGGPRQWSGLRTKESEYYSPYSQHTFGRAVDMLFKDISAEEARKWIKDNLRQFEGIPVTLEEDVSWLHIDVRNGLGYLNTFNV